jgi:tRNA threonylcarbamoyladenosine biosynthesis protein TsaB
MILALETSSSLCAVCVLDETTGEALAEISNNIGRGHAERLMDDVAEVLKLAGTSYSALTAVVCGVGPGSFTGIRVGVSAARGFGLALKIPVHGVTSLQAIALLAGENVRDKAVFVVQDAGRDELHVQRFDTHATPLGAPEALTLPMLHDQLRGRTAFACGSGAHLLAGFGNTEISPHAIIATALSVARASLDPAMRVTPKPLYLRAPDAKPQAGSAVARTGL